MALKNNNNKTALSTIILHTGGQTAEEFNPPRCDSERSPYLPGESFSMTVSHIILNKVYELIFTCTYRFLI